MINANELRIGNWVLIEDQFKWKPFQVTGIEMASEEKKIDLFADPFIRYKLGATILNFPNEEPEEGVLVRSIRLTPEILEKKCKGFEVAEPDGWYHYKPTKESQTLELFLQEDGLFHYADGAFSPIIEFVHELQNLVFVLTKKELQINF